MKRLFHHPLSGGLFFSGLAALCLLAPASAEKVPEKLPKVEPLKHKGYTETFPGSSPGTKIKFDMVPIPGGVYLMGSSKNEKGRLRDDEGPQHPVAVRPFWMGKCEVTWDEYDIFRKEMGVDHPTQNDMRLKAKPDAIT